ncbi:hypothetical protein [Streptomyces sp. 3N207]|uniref:hypothetical protein n=1 Tax=Streptomyces sp. 3N207 TaxID=3457417 RepID=UPI003FCFA40D
MDDRWQILIKPRTVLAGPWSIPCRKATTKHRPTNKPCYVVRIARSRGDRIPAPADDSLT